MTTVNYEITDADPNVTITITDPDGTKTTTTADESGNTVITLDKEGEWSFKYKISGIETTNTRTVTAEELNNGSEEPTLPEPTLGTDSIMHITEKQFQHALIRILQKNNERIVAHFTDKVTEGDTNHIPTSDTIYKALQEAVNDATSAGADEAKEYTDEQIQKLAEDLAEINNWKYEEVIGELPEDPDEKTIYLQIDDENDLTHIMKIYSDGKWIDIGDTSIDLVEYWKKDNITGLSDALVDSEYFMSKLFGGGDITPPDPTDVEQTVSTPFVVTADPGSTVTATHEDGETVITAVANDDGKAIIVLPKAGTWNFIITRDGEEVVKDVTVVDPSEPEIPIVDPSKTDGNNEIPSTTTINPLVLNVGTDITVKAVHPDGDEVTADSDENGIVILVLPKDGIWTLSYYRTSDEAPREPLAGSGDTVDVTSEPEVVNEPIIINAKPGSTVTATHEDGETVITAVANDDGKAIFILPKSGAWSISYTTLSDDNITTDIEVKEPEKPVTSLDDRYWEKSKLTELVDEIDSTGEFFNRTNVTDYSNAWKLLGTDANKSSAIASTGVTDDETIFIKNSAVDALDNLTYIRDIKLAQLLGAVKETEIGTSIEGTPAILGSEADFTFAEITFPTAGDWKVTGTYLWDEKSYTDTFYITVTDEEAPLTVDTYNAFNSTRLYSSISAIKVERTLNTPLTTDTVKETIVKTIQDSGALGELGEEDLANLKEQLELDKLGDTYLTLEDTHEAFDIPENEEINNESMEDAIMRIVNKNSDKIEAITDERLDELMNLAIEETVVTLANSGIATDEEVQARLNKSFENV